MAVNRGFDRELLSARLISVDMDADEYNRSTKRAGDNDNRRVRWYDISHPGV